MKKKLCFRFDADVSKLLRKMKLTLSIILLAVLSSFATENYAQATKLTLDLKNSTVKEILNEIESQSEFRFFYSVIVDVERKTSINQKNENIFDILDELFEDTGVIYEVYGKQIALFQGNESLGFEVVSVAQQKSISGKVIDTKGQSLPGVTVVVKGSLIGTVTNADGNFSLTNVPDDVTLVFSFVGMHTQEIVIGDQTVINVSLKEESIGIEEVVAIGYGTMKKKDITGAVSQVKSDEISNQNPTNIATALQGKIPALVKQSSAAPGSTTKIEIRGISSLTGSNDPLWVVDGVPMQSGSLYLNPGDIESIDVLKDASATAIYGSRGSNGVIIVTTKMIDTNLNTVKVSYDGWVGVDKVAESSILDLNNGAQYAERKRLAFINSGQVATDNTIFDPIELESIALGRSTDWFDLVWGGSAVSTNHHLTVNASAKNMATSVSLGYLRENSIIENANFKRYNIKINNVFNASKRLKITTSVLANNSLRNQMPSALQVFRTSPLGTPYDENGNIKLFVNPSEAMGTNPLAEIANNKDEIRHYGFIGNTSLEWQITDGLKYRFFSGADYTSARRGEYIGSQTMARSGGPHQANYSNSNILSTIIDNVISYKKTFNAIHRIDAIAGFTAETYRYERSFLNGTDMDYEGLWYNLGAASTIINKGTSLEEWGIESFLGRVNYSFSEKYILTLSYRYDGSSRLSEGNKWSGFPSAALAWRINEEKFMNKFNFIDNLKLRLTWGLTGNTSVDPYETLGLLGKTYYDWDGAPAIGYVPTQITNPDLKWETTEEKNLGLDFGFLKGKLFGSVDIYNQLTRDLMLSRNLPITSGFAAVTQNVGSVKNNGIELTLGSEIIDYQGFKWNLGLTFAKNKNEIVDLYGDKKDDTGSKWFIGKPIRVAYLTHYLGIWQLGEEAQAAVYKALPGYAKILDVKNENEDSPMINNLDRLITSLDPKWIGGVNSSFQYKGFDLNLSLYISQGGKFEGSPGAIVFYNMDQRLNGRWNMLNEPYWTVDNPTNKNPMPSVSEKSRLNLDDSDFMIRDVSFVRLADINLGYQFSKSVSDFLKIESLRAYVNIKNPYIWTPYEGMDPESGTNVDAHPLLTSFQFGLNVNF